MAATAFFDAYHVRFPYLNRGEYLVDLQDIQTAEQGSGGGLSDPRKEFSVLMITSVGAYLCEQKGEMESGIAQSLRERAMRSLATATSRTDLVSFVLHLWNSAHMTDHSTSVPLITLLRSTRPPSRDDGSQRTRSCYADCYQP